MVERRKKEEWKESEKRSKALGLLQVIRLHLGQCEGGW